jgi:hypothetical protein
MESFPACLFFVFVFVFFNIFSVQVSSLCTTSHPIFCVRKEFGVSIIIPDPSSISNARNYSCVDFAEFVLTDLEPTPPFKTKT